MSPECVLSYVKAQKSDDRDAVVIAEAATRPTMRFAGLKSDEQLDVQTLHCARDRPAGDATVLGPRLAGLNTSMAPEARWRRQSNSADE